MWILPVGVGSDKLSLNFALQLFKSGTLRSVHEVHGFRVRQSANIPKNLRLMSRQNAGEMVFSMNLQILHMPFAWRAFEIQKIGRVLGICGLREYHTLSFRNATFRAGKQ